MSTLPEIKQEQILKNVNNKLSEDNSSLLEQVATLELLATALRDQRDQSYEENSRLRDQLSNHTPEEVLQPDEIHDPVT